MVTAVVQHHRLGPPYVLRRIAADGHHRGKRRVNLAHAGLHHLAVALPFLGNRQHHRDIAVLVGNRHRVQFQVRHNLVERVGTCDNDIVAPGAQRSRNAPEVRRHPYRMHALRHQAAVKIAGEKVHAVPVRHQVLQLVLEHARHAVLADKYRREYRDPHSRPSPALLSSLRNESSTPMYQAPQPIDEGNSGKTSNSPRNSITMPPPSRARPKPSHVRRI